MLAQNGLYYAAAATTVIAGILHLITVPNILNFNPSVNFPSFFQYISGFSSYSKTLEYIPYYSCADK
jgi:hypothetical protein